MREQLSPPQGHKGVTHIIIGELTELLFSNAQPFSALLLCVCVYTSCEIAVYNVIQNAIQIYCAEFDPIYTGFKINSSFTSNWLSISWLLF